jgi:hypothetical protein
LGDFNLIDDDGLRIMQGMSFDVARKCDYGCGLFVFSKFADGDKGKVRE